MCWFAGLGAAAVSVDVSSGTSNAAHTKNSRQAAPRNKKKSTTTAATATQSTQLCVSKWYGYRGAYDVLRRFGYSLSFVECVITRASQQLTKKKQKEIEIISNPASLANRAFSSGGNAHRSASMANLANSATYAVRGSSIAYPTHAHRPPRLIRMNTQNQNGNQNKTPHKTPKQAKQHRAVQFLDATHSRAVCMSTGPFDNQYHTAIPQPCVVFCVGIATEDGVFLSGIHNRFELGHGYPTLERDAQLDMCSACMTASDSTNFVDINRQNGEDVKNHNAPLHRENESSSDGSDENNEISRNSHTSNHDDDDSSDSSASCLPHPDEIVRGVSGPGQWHVYTCVFDHDQSVLRVDGRAESSHDTATSLGSNVSVGGNALDGLTLGSDHQFFMTLCAGNHGVDVNGGTPGNWTGSDSNGAIAEVAVFHGLPMEDVLRLERYFLDKYDKVPDLERVSLNDMVREEEWRRQSCALMEQPPQRQRPRSNAGVGAGANDSSDADVNPVPLRIAARHGIVAWHRNDPVTGKIIPVSRIGSKSVGSSDW